MKAIVCISLFALIAVALARPNEDTSTYTDKYDNVNLDEVLVNDRLREPYLKCMLDQGKCAPDGKELKSHIKEALETHCAKCNKKQEEGVRKVIKYLINEKPDEWKQLVEKYDPNQEYSKKYESELKEVKG